MVTSKVQFVSVTEDEDNIRLDRWFQRHFPDITHGQLEKMLRQKEVKVDGKKASSNLRLVAGQSIRIPPLEGRIKKAEENKKVKTTKPRKAISEEEITALQESVLYKDKDILAINKRAGLAVQGGSGIAISLDDMLEHLQFEAEEKPKLVHRLDKDTSGVLLLARNKVSAATLTKLFREKDMQKTYWALVVGLPNPYSGKIDLPLIKQGKDGNEKVEVNKKEGQKAVTLYEMVEKVGRELTWMKLTPVTGRTHQLRVHMAAIGHPIVGDGKYGGKSVFISGISNKLHLHSREIVLKLMPKGKEINITAPLPPHMESSWEMLGLDN